MVEEKEKQKNDIVEVLNGWMKAKGGKGLQKGKRRKSIKREERERVNVLIEEKEKQKDDMKE